MARRSKKKRNKIRVPIQKPVNDPVTGMPDMKQFVLWLNHTPEARADFNAFCRKHRLERESFSAPAKSKNYSGSNPAFIETESGFVYDFGFNGARGYRDVDLLSEATWRRMGCEIVSD